MSPMMYHRLEVYVLDFENYGIGDVLASLDHIDSYSFKVGEYQSTVIPEWTDDHELNKTKCTLETRRKYFDVKQVGQYVDVPLRPDTVLEEENKKLHRENRELKDKLLRLKNSVEREFIGVKF